MNLDFSQAQILIVGDVMLDSYWQGPTQRISPEAPVPVVHVINQSKRLGGSANVAMNISSLGANASLFGLIGDDLHGRELSGLLDSSGVNNCCQVDNSITTTTKLRVLSQNQQLIRLDFEETRQDCDTVQLLNNFQQQLSHADVVVLSDYGKGVLNDAQPFIRVAKRSSVPVLIDPKKNHFDNYAGAQLLTPNQKEFEAVVGICSDEAVLVEKARAVIRECNINGLLITQGGRGMTLVIDGQPAEHFPAHAKEVYDVTGAGDTVIGALATGLANGMSSRDAVFLASKAAGIVVGRVGTAAVTVKDIEMLDRQASHKLSPIAEKMKSEAACLKEVKKWQQQGEKIAFTNGCFDLIHAGHVSYLEKAAALADVLIVGVNSDDSVKQLKGADRPINPLTDRLQVLASLASVDMVLPFSETTPERLLSLIKPDVLIKGGDYKVEEVLGREHAGEVKLINFVDGKSSTRMIDTIKQQD